MLGLGLGLGLTRTDGNWFDSGFFFAGGQVAALALDFENSRYAVNQEAVDSSYLTDNGDGSFSLSGTNFSDWFNNTEGTFIVEVESPSDTSGSSAYIIDVTDGTSNNRILMAASSSDADLVFFVNNSGSTSASLANDYDAVGVNRIFAASYKQNDFTNIVDGTTPKQDNTGNIPTVDRMGIGGVFGGGSNLFGSGIKKVAYFDTKLTDEQTIQATQNLEAADFTDFTVNGNTWTLQRPSGDYRYSAYQNQVDNDVTYYELRPNQPAIESDVTNDRSRVEGAHFGARIDPGQRVSRKFSLVFLEQDTDHTWQIFYQVYDPVQDTAAISLETRSGGTMFNLSITGNGGGEVNISLSSDGFEIGRRYDFYLEFLLDENNGEIYLEVNDVVAYEAYGVGIGTSGQTGTNRAYDKHGIYREPQSRATEETARTIVYDFTKDDTGAMAKTYGTSAEFNYTRGSITLTKGAFSIGNHADIVAAWDADTATKTYTTDEATGDVATIQGDGALFTSSDTNDAIYTATAFDNAGALVASSDDIALTMADYDASSGWSIGIVFENGTGTGSIMGVDNAFQNRFRQTGTGATGDGTHWDDAEGSSNVSFSTTSGKHIVVFTSADNSDVDVAFDDFDETHSFDPRGGLANAAQSVALFSRAVGASDVPPGLKIGSFFAVNSVISDADKKNWIGQKALKYDVSVSR